MPKTWKRTIVFLVTVLSVLMIVGYHYFETTSHLIGLPKKKTVIFLETSGKGTLDLRQLASVESAARFVPNSQVIVFIFTQEKFIRNSHMVTLEKEYKVQFNRTTFEDFICGTPLEPWFKKGVWKKSPFVVSHMSDALRYLSLWKYGGIYFDLDVLLTRMWDVKNNTVITEVQGRLGSAVLAFKKGHPVLLNCITWLENNYEPNVWIANGPALITAKVNEYVSKYRRQNSVSILPVSAFYEISFTEVNKLFDTNFTREVLNRTASSFGIHVWNRLSAGISAPKNSTCAYKIFLSKSSPLIYASMQSEQTKAEA